MILVLCIIAVIGFAMYFSVKQEQEIEEGNNRILDKINSLIDGVKTFFTVTLVERFTSAADDSDDEIDTIQ